MKNLLICLSIIFLAACSNSSAEHSAFKASEKHLENITLNGVDNPFDTIEIRDGQLTIVFDSLSNTIKPEINPEKLKGKNKTEEIYKISSITTKEIKTEDNFTLELKRVGDRILSDENGKKYQTSMELD